MTITGGLFFSHGSFGIDAGENSVDAVTCDVTSSFLRFDGSSTIGTNTCPADGTPSGIKGDKGDPGVPGLSGREVVTTAPLTQTLARQAQVSVVATCPAGKVVLGGGSSSTNPSVSVLSSLPTSATEWTVVFANITNFPQTSTLTVKAVCATIP